MATGTKPVARQNRVDIGIKVDLKYPDRDTFVQRFSQNLSRSGIFIRAKDPVPAGSRVRFEYRLADGTRILRGLGIVRWARTTDEARDPEQPAGMGIEFVDLDAESEELIERVVAQFGEGKRAPHRAAPKPAASAPRASAAPRPARTLDPDEEDELESLLAGLPMAGSTRRATSAAARPTPASDGMGSDEGVPGAPAEPSPEPTPGETPPPDEAPPPDLGPPPQEPDSSAVEELALATPPAPELPIALDVDGTPLAAAADAVRPSHEAPAIDGEPELLADLAASEWRGALVPRGGAFQGFGDAVAVTAGEGESAQELPSPLGWLVAPWPAPKARVVARRLGIELTDDDSGFPAIRWQGLTLSSAAIVQLGLEKLLSACAPQARPRHARIVVPAATGDAAKRLLLRRLAGLGVLRCTVVSAPVAAARAGVPDGKSPALVVEVLALETRLTLVGEGDAVLASTAILEASATQADTALATQLGASTGSHAGTLAAARLARSRLADGPWSFRLGAETHTVIAAQLEDRFVTMSESVALAGDSLVREHGLDPAELTTVVAAEAPPWPGLDRVLTSILGGRVVLLGADPWAGLSAFTST